MESAGKKFECKICLEKHASPIDLQCHWGVHFKDILCEQCDFAFSTSDSLDHHVRAVHDKIETIPPLIPIPTATPKGLQVCAHGDFKTVYTLEMKKCEKQVHFENIEELDVGSSSVRNIANYEKDSSGAVIDRGQIALLECGQCKHKTATSKKFQRHVEKSHNKEIHCCDHCKFKTNIFGKHIFTTLSNAPSVHMRQTQRTI